MKHSIPGYPQTAALAAIIAVLAAYSSPVKAADAAATPAQWQEHKGSIDYFGLTSHYSCTGIESQVKQVLKTLGARKDMVVDASGCTSLDRPSSHSLTVSVHMYSLAPADKSDTASPVMASWAPVEIKPKHPYFVDDGDCELIDQMKGFIAKNFSAQNLDYRAACTPHEVTMDSFNVHGEFLKTSTP
jgi:hypothetical protein